MSHKTVTRDDARLIAEAASDCADKAAHWKTRALAAESALATMAGEICTTSPIMREALVDVESLLALVEHPAIPDSAWEPHIEALGQSIGYGNLMATASALWRKGD